MIQGIVYAIQWSNIQYNTVNWEIYDAINLVVWLDLKNFQREIPSSEFRVFYYYQD